MMEARTISYTIGVQQDNSVLNDQEMKEQMGRIFDPVSRMIVEIMTEKAKEKHLNPSEIFTDETYITYKLQFSKVTGTDAVKGILKKLEKETEEPQQEPGMEELNAELTEFHKAAWKLRDRIEGLPKKYYWDYESVYNAIDEMLLASSWTVEEEEEE